MPAPAAFLLLTLPNTTLTAQGKNQSGVLSLECVTIDVANTAAPEQRDVYLVLRLGSIETPIDPARVIRRTDGGGWRTYTFYPTEVDPSEIVVSVSPPTPSSGNHAQFTEDLDTFETILAQYADLQGAPESVSVANPIASDDLRGHLVVVNQDNGEVVGQFDDAKFRVQEDPRLHEKGHENDAVIIEVPEGNDYGDANALQMFMRAVPPDQQDWITKSATIVSHGISTGTNLLLTTISTASNYYIAHSAPSPHHSDSAKADSVKAKSPSGGASGSGTPPPLPPRALVFLTSERTRKGLAGVHAVSGQAVKVSSKTVSLIDGMIRRAMGAKPKKGRQFLPPPNPASPYATEKLSRSSSFGSGWGGHASPQPRHAPSPSPSYLAPPAYPGPPESFPQDKPSLPPRRATSPAPPFPPRTSSGPPSPYPSHPSPSPPQQPQGPIKPLSTTARVILSADLILSTIDHETRRLLDSGTLNLGAVVGHKYGAEAKESSLLMAGTVRNVGLVYVDMRGIGRKALLRSAGTTFVKARVSSNRPEGSGQVQGQPQ